MSLGSGFSAMLGFSGSRSSNSSKGSKSESFEKSGSQTNSESTSQRGSQRQQQSALSEQSLADLRNIILKLQGETTAESQAAVRDAAIANTIEAGMADIIGLGTNSGAYNSTVQGRAGQKLASRAALEGEQAQVQAQQGFISLLQNLIDTEKGAQTSSSTLEEQFADLLSNSSYQESGKSDSEFRGKEIGKNFGWETKGSFSYGAGGQ